LRSMQINHSTECTTGVGNQKRHSQWNSSGCNKHICSAQVLFTYSTVDCKFGKYFTPKLRLHLNTIFSGLQVSFFLLWRRSTYTPVRPICRQIHQHAS